MREYENQKDIDALQEAIETITPDIKLRCFSVCGNRALAAIVEIDEKGNKAVINKLISIGFRKKSRYRKPIDHFALLSTKDTFAIRLEKEI